MFKVKIYYCELQKCDYPKLPPNLIIIVCVRVCFGETNTHFASLRECLLSNFQVYKNMLNIKYIVSKIYSSNICKVRTLTI